ncbi:MAG: hypothetical protein Q8P67_20330, partial [archaeon]|nr:hypothetical protein [archaeon]
MSARRVDFPLLISGTVTVAIFLLSAIKHTYALSDGVFVLNANAANRGELWRLLTFFLHCKDAFVPFFLTLALFARALHQLLAHPAASSVYFHPLLQLAAFVLVSVPVVAFLSLHSYGHGFMMATLLLHALSSTSPPLPTLDDPSFALDTKEQREAKLALLSRKRQQ